MSISNSERGRRRYSKLAISALIVIAVELIVHFGTSKVDSVFLLENRFYPPNRIPTIEESIVQWQVFHSLAERAPSNVLFLGDCSVLLGFVPALVTKETGFSAWNLGTMAVFGPDGHSEMLELFNRKRGAPKFLVYNATIAALARRGDIDWQTRLSQWIGPLLGKQTLSLPSYRVRNLAQRLLFNFSFANGYPAELLRAKGGARGKYPSDEEINNSLKVSHGYLARIEPDEEFREPIRVDGHFVAENIPGIRKVLSLSRAADARVLFTITPMPEISRTPETEKITKEVVDEVRKIVADYDNVELLPPRYYPNDHFASLYHLNERGAERNTREVNRWLFDKARLAAAASNQEKR